jgi:hypothetical protein
MSHELAIAVCEKRVRVHEAPARGRRKPSRFRTPRALADTRLGRGPRIGGDRGWRYGGAGGEARQARVGGDGGTRRERADECAEVVRPQ